MLLAVRPPYPPGVVGDGGKLAVASRYAVYAAERESRRLPGPATPATDGPAFNSDNEFASGGGSVAPDDVR